VSGIDSFIAIILLVAAAMCIFWSLRSLTIQFSVPQFIFFGMFCVLIGVFFESWVAGTRELVLSTAAILVLSAVYVLWKSKRAIANSLGGRR